MVSVDRWSSFNVAYVYHYTSISCSEKILSSMVIRPTNARIRQLGRGVFATEMGPWESTKKLVYNNYLGDGRRRYKTKCAFALPKRDLKVVSLKDPSNTGRNLRRIDSVVDLNKVAFYLIMRE